MRAIQTCQRIFLTSSSGYKIAYVSFLGFLNLTMSQTSPNYARRDFLFCLSCTLSSLISLLLLALNIFVFYSTTFSRTLHSYVTLRVNCPIHSSNFNSNSFTVKLGNSLSASNRLTKSVDPFKILLIL